MDWASVLSPKLGHVAKVSEQRLGSLWAGYGIVSRLQLHPQKISLVAKQVRPPQSSGVGHERKVHSYEVECTFYDGPAQYAASMGVNLPKPVFMHKDGKKGFTLVLTDLEPDFPNKSARGAMGVRELKPALEWLARFHAAFWEATPSSDPSAPPTKKIEPKLSSLWPQGTFWHLGTRMDEYNAMDSRHWLHGKAHEIDARLRGYASFAELKAGAPPSSQHQTLVHGDFKAANLLFSSNWEATAAYDFQYVGRGLGAVDVAYLIICSSSLSVVERHEDELLAHYHRHLMACLQERGIADNSYTLEVLRMHYDLSTLDLMRFFLGWGWWGAIPEHLGNEYAKKIGARVFGHV